MLKCSQKFSCFKQFVPISIVSNFWVGSQISSIFEKSIFNCIFTDSWLINRQQHNVCKSKLCFKKKPIVSKYHNLDKLEKLFAICWYLSFGPPTSSLSIRLSNFLRKLRMFLRISMQSLPIATFQYNRYEPLWVSQIPILKNRLYKPMQ